MAITIVEATDTPNEGRVIWNDNFIDLDGRINEVELGIDAYSTTSASFVQPAVDATVSVTVDETGWMAVGQPVYMVTGGHYSVSSVTDTTTVVLTNLGYSGNAAPAATVASGKKVSPSGVIGATGSTPDASETVKGKAELATQTETDTGTDDTRILTPLKAATRYLAKAGGTLTDFLTLHADPTSDMHAATKQYVDAAGGGGSGYTPPWIVTGANALYAGYGDGNPEAAAQIMQDTGAGPTPTQVSTTVIRCQKFRLPVALSVSDIYMLGNGVVSSIYTFAIYPVGTGSTKLWDHGGTAVSSVNGWANANTGLPVSIAADTDYWWCFGANTTGASTGFYSPLTIGNFTIFWGTGAVGPFAAGRSIGIHEYAQFSTTAGAMPSTLPAVGPPAAWTGNTVPIPWMVGTAS